MTTSRETKRIPILSLFCGCGGFDLGFSSQGFDVSLALDLSKAAVDSYNHNHKTASARVADVSKLRSAKLDCMLGSAEIRGVIGGAPCQSFSNGNVHKREDDERSSLPSKYASLLKHLNRNNAIDFFVFENVQGINSARHEKTFSQFKRKFKRAGFRLFEGMLDAKDFGVPQVRPRIFVVGFNKQRFPDVEFEFPAPNAGKTPTVGSAIRELGDPAFFRRDLVADDIPTHPNHWTMMPKSRKFSNGSLTEGVSWGRSFRVLSWDQPSWTVAYGNREIHIHPSGKRRLSVYEAMLLQGFPEDYELKGTLSEQIRQVSDSVPMQVGAALAKAIRANIAGKKEPRP